MWVWRIFVLLFSANNIFYGNVVRIFVNNIIFMFIFSVTNKSTINITKVFITTMSVYMWIM